MKDKIMTFVELDTVARNLDMLDARLGYSAPRHFLGSEELSDGIMSLEEVDTTARNIEMLDTLRGSSRRGNELTIWIECWPIYLFALVMLTVILF